MENKIELKEIWEGNIFKENCEILKIRINIFFLKKRGDE